MAIAADSFLRMCDGLVTDPIGESEARFIASDWHDGQWSDMYGFASSGELTDAHGLAREVERAYEQAGDVEGTEELLSLYQWVANTPQYAAEELSDD